MHWELRGHMGDRGLFDALGAERAQLKGLRHNLETENIRVWLV